jgi:DNA-binding NarL/FixJ family response regulator
MPIRILIAEDHTLVAQGYAKLFEGRDDIEVVGFAMTFHEIVFKLQAIRADVLLLDLSMPETRVSSSQRLAGFSVLEFIQSHSVNIKKLVVSNHRDYELVRKAMSLGADGYILKSADYKELVLAIGQIQEGRKYLQKEVEMILNEKRKGENCLGTGAVLLTPREKEILCLLGEGLSTEDMMKVLNLKKDTINEYRQNLIRKFNARNAAHLVKLAFEMNFFS